MNEEQVRKIVDEIVEGWDEKEHPRDKDGKFTGDGGDDEDEVNRLRMQIVRDPKFTPKLTGDPKKDKAAKKVLGELDAVSAAMKRYMEKSGK